MGLSPEMAALVERAARAEAEGLDHHRNGTILNLYAKGHYEAARAIKVNRPGSPVAGQQTSPVPARMAIARYGVGTNRNVPVARTLQCVGRVRSA